MLKYCGDEDGDVKWESQSPVTGTVQYLCLSPAILDDLDYLVRIGLYPGTGCVMKWCKSRRCHVDVNKQRQCNTSCWMHLGRWGKGPRESMMDDTEARAANGCALGRSAYRLTMHLAWSDHSDDGGTLNASKISPKRKAKGNWKGWVGGWWTSRLGGNSLAQERRVGSWGFESGIGEFEIWIWR